MSIWRVINIGCWIIATSRPAYFRAAMWPSLSLALSGFCEQSLNAAGFTYRPLLPHSLFLPPRSTAGIITRQTAWRASLITTAGWRVTEVLDRYA